MFLCFYFWVEDILAAFTFKFWWMFWLNVLTFDECEFSDSISFSAPAFFLVFLAGASSYKAYLESGSFGFRFFTVHCNFI